MDLSSFQAPQRPLCCLYFDTAACLWLPMKEGFLPPVTNRWMQAFLALFFPLFQCLRCWKMRVSRGFLVSNRWATGIAPPAWQMVTAPTAWMRSFASWTRSTASCVTRAWTQRSSSRSSSSSSTWSTRSPSTTSCWGRMSAPGARACSSGGTRAWDGVPPALRKFS